MRSFAIEDPGSPDPPLYATLVFGYFDNMNIIRLSIWPPINYRNWGQKHEWHCFYGKKDCWIASQIHIKFDTTPALPFISLPPVHQCTIETSQELRKLPATSYLENERWQQRLCWKITSYQCVLFCSPICAFGKTNSQHLRDEIIRSTDQMGRKMIQYWFNRINTELRKWRWKWNENSM